MAKYFNENEFACKCGCGTKNIDSELVDKLDKAREIAGIPFVITSGLRCKTHNKNVGGVANSSHVQGLAADISVKNNNTRFIIMKALIEAGFDRIGISSNFIHVDCDKTKSRNTIWEY